MARKYKRDSQGRFAGGGGGGGSGGKKSGGKKKNSVKSARANAKAAIKKQKATKANAKAKAPTSESKATAKVTPQRTKPKRTVRQKVITFAVNNPRVVVGLAAGATSLAINGRSMLNSATAARKVSNSTRFANDMKAAMRGIGVGSAGLKAIKPNRRGVYKL